ncbi:MAG: 16S rRNA (cytosine(1402)-N(4))-methyltransferase RsmH [Christensenellales bacterium]|jgi:16S rRNA (cytosine1402-N4)-methyltransferase
MMQSFGHIPVLLSESLSFLSPVSGGTYLDGTLGMGGHAEAILEAGSPDSRLVGIDRDREALAAAQRRLSRFADRFISVHGDFRDAVELLRQQDIAALDGAILDLGVSSYQFDTPERGFSYGHDAPLDMRMDRSGGTTARDVVNGYTQPELAQVIRTYGEERWAARIAQFIVRERERVPIETTGQLADIIRKAIPAGARRTGPHPARRTFQALRIEVNQELRGLEEAVESIAGLLNPGARLCVISFHSLEDRAVKTAMRRMENPCTCPRSAPVCVCGRKPIGKASPRGAVEPRPEETESNPRARSARMRVFEKY